MWLGLFEKETHPWLLDLSRDIRTAVDIGAAEGEYSLYFLLKTAATQVFAFEPDLKTQETMQTNLALNGIMNSRRLRLLADFIGSAKNECSLDSFANDISEPCLIKIDTDGAEAKILESANLLLTKSRIRWLIETHSPDLESHCLQKLRDAGFLTQVIPNARWRVILPELRMEHNRWLVAFRENDLPAQIRSGSGN